MKNEMRQRERTQKSEDLGKRRQEKKPSWFLVQRQTNDVFYAIVICNLATSIAIHFDTKVIICIL